MDLVIKNWMDRNYGYFAHDKVNNTANSTAMAAYSILEIINNSLQLFVDYVYRENIKIFEYYHEYTDKSYAPLDSYTIHTFSFQADDDIKMALSIVRKNNDIIRFEIFGTQCDKYGRVSNTHNENVSDSCFNYDEVSTAANVIINNIIKYIISDENKEAFFILQGINLRNYLK